MASIPLLWAHPLYTVRMGTPLVICIGNVARGDDGVAHRVAELLAGEDDRGIRIITAPDLDVSMAQDVAEASLLILVDAERRSAPAVRTAALVPGSPTKPTGHGIDAAGLLAVTEALYDAAPPAELVSVSAPEMGHSDRLSSHAEAAAREAAASVLNLIEHRGG